AKMLRKKGACDEEQIELFFLEWPNGAEVTKENVLRAFELQLSVPWAVTHLLGKQYAEWNREFKLPLKEVFTAETFRKCWNNAYAETFVKCWNNTYQK
ncbi:MAG TPA: hypothetical protein VJ521_04290, partial [Acidobacteriota bacterium]|nr:hypothetical protein [Acidobacteriota bacterium]